MNNSRSKESIWRVIDVIDLVPGDVIRYGALWVVIGVEEERIRILCMNSSDPVFAQFYAPPGARITVFIH